MIKNYLSKTDFSQCRFIEDCMRYSDIFDFIKIGHIIKIRFEKQLDDNGKIFYKYFVYAHTNTTRRQKNAIWDYLNGDKEAIYSCYNHIKNKM